MPPAEGSISSCFFHVDATEEGCGGQAHEHLEWRHLRLTPKGCASQVANHERRGRGLGVETELCTTSDTALFLCEGNDFFFIYTVVIYVMLRRSCMVITLGHMGKRARGALGDVSKMLCGGSGSGCTVGSHGN